jgi:hypothetical protein
MKYTRTDRVRDDGRKDNARKGVVKKAHCPFRKDNITAIWPSIKKVVVPFHKWEE